MLHFRLSVDGVPQVSRVLDIAADAADDLRPAWDEVVDAFHQVEGRHFTRSGAGPSGRFAPLSPAYARWKARRYGRRPILTATGRLAESLTGENEESIVERRRLELEIGTRTPYARFHQRGTSRMPARPPIDLPNSFKREAVRAIQRHLQARIQARRR